MISGGLLVQKKEMTRLWIQNRFVPVTLVTVLTQKVVRHKTLQQDGYVALVVEVSGLRKKPWHYEVRGDEGLLSRFPVNTALDESLLDGVDVVRLTGTSQGKGFQGVMKRHNFAGGPETHGSKFHRVGGSTGNRKPRRTHKGHPMAGRMGGDTVTLRTVPLITVLDDGTGKVVALKGSVPGAYNSILKLAIS